MAHLSVRLSTRLSLLELLQSSKSIGKICRSSKISERMSQSYFIVEEINKMKLTELLTR